MSHEFSFEIRNINDWHSKLQREFKRMVDVGKSVDHAINFAITAHHLYSDWLQPIHKGRVAKILNGPLRIEFEIIRDLCEGSKHSGRDKGKSSIIVRTYERDGTYDYTFDNSYEKYQLIVVADNGREYDFVGVAQKILKFWDDYFDELKSDIRK